MKPAGASHGGTRQPTGRQESTASRSAHVVYLECGDVVVHAVARTEVEIRGVTRGVQQVRVARRVVVEPVPVESPPADLHTHVLVRRRTEDVAHTDAARCRPG